VCRAGRELAIEERVQLVVQRARALRDGDDLRDACETSFGGKREVAGEVLGHLFVGGCERRDVALPMRIDRPSALRRAGTEDRNEPRRQ
jgi:hypothetical protein